MVLLLYVTTQLGTKVALAAIDGSPSEEDTAKRAVCKYSIALSSKAPHSLGLVIASAPKLETPPKTAHAQLLGKKILFEPKRTKKASCHEPGVNKLGTLLVAYNSQGLVMLALVKVLSVCSVLFLGCYEVSLCSLHVEDKFLEVLPTPL